MFRFTESHSPGMVWIGKDPKDHLVPTPWHKQDSWEFGLPVAELLEGPLRGNHILLNQPTLAAKGVFPPVCVISEGGWSSSADGGSCCQQWSGRAWLLPSPLGLKPGRKGWSLEQHQHCQTAHFQCSEMKNDPSRNQAGNLIFPRKPLKESASSLRLLLAALDHHFPGHREEPRQSLSWLCPFNKHQFLCVLPAWHVQ